MRLSNLYQCLAFFHFQPFALVLVPFARPPTPASATPQTYVGIFILSQLFEIGITLDALAQKNIIQLIMLVFFQCAMVSQQSNSSVYLARLPRHLLTFLALRAQTTYAAFLPGQLSEAIFETSADTETTEKRVRAFAIVIACIVSFLGSIGTYLAKGGG